MISILRYLSTNLFLLFHGSSSSKDLKVCIGSHATISHQNVLEELLVCHSIFKSIEAHLRTSTKRYNQISHGLETYVTPFLLIGGSYEMLVRSSRIGMFIHRFNGEGANCGGVIPIFSQAHNVMFFKHPEISHKVNRKLSWHISHGAPRKRKHRRETSIPRARNPSPRLSAQFLCPSSAPNSLYLPRSQAETRVS